MTTSDYDRFLCKTTLKMLHEIAMWTHDCTLRRI